MAFCHSPSLFIDKWSTLVSELMVWYKLNCKHKKKIYIYMHLIFFLWFRTDKEDDIMHASERWFMRWLLSRTIHPWLKSLKKAKAPSIPKVKLGVSYTAAPRFTNWTESSGKNLDTLSDNFDNMFAGGVGDGSLGCRSCLKRCRCLKWSGIIETGRGGTLLFDPMV